MESYSNSCRMCLGGEKEGVELNEEFTEYSKQLEEIFQIEFPALPGWPLAICSSCVLKLQATLDFKATIIVSQEKLFKLLPEIRIKNEPADIDEALEVPSIKLEAEDPLGSEIVAQVWIKEEIYNNEDAEQDNSGKEEPEWKYDASSETASEEDYKSTVSTKSKDLPPFYSKSLSEKATLDKMLQDLGVLSCLVCHEQLGSLDELNYHSKNVHKKTYSRILCCGKFFRGSMSETYGHMRFHLDNEAFKCGECGKISMCDRDLAAHKKDVHAPSSFKCTTCGKTFKTKKLLKRHGFSHIDPRERRHKCPQCDKSYNHIFRLQNHLRKIHGIMK